MCPIYGISLGKEKLGGCQFIIRYQYAGGEVWWGIYKGGCGEVTSTERRDEYTGKLEKSKAEDKIQILLKKLKGRGWLRKHSKYWNVFWFFVDRRTLRYS
jgi:hypothetical protein